MRSIVFGLCSLLILVLTASVALAQDSGGSMGGGSWDSGGGGGGGSASGVDIVGGVIFLGVCMLVWVIKHGGSSISSGIASYSPDTTGHVDVTLIRVGLDARSGPTPRRSWRGSPSSPTPAPSRGWC